MPCRLRGCSTIVASSLRRNNRPLIFRKISSISFRPFIADWNFTLYWYSPSRMTRLPSVTFARRSAPSTGGHGDARLAEFRLVGDNQQFRGNGAAQVDHGYLGQLLDAFGDDLRGKTAQRREPIGYGMPFVPVPGRLIPPYGEVDIEGRDVGDARLDYLRALHVAGQGGRRTVDLLVHFDEQVVDVRALLEGQADNAVSFAGLAAQVGQLRQLDELLPQRGDDGFIQLPGPKAPVRGSAP